MKQPVNSFPYFVRTLAKYEKGRNKEGKLAFQKNTVYRRILIILHQKRITQYVMYISSSQEKRVDWQS